MRNGKGSMNRRGFLKGAAVGAAAGAAALVAPRVGVPGSLASAAASAALPEPVRLTPAQTAELQARETAPLPPEQESLTVSDPGSDFMVDVLKTLNFEYIAANPASSARGLHESLDSYGGNKNPEWLTCCHEVIALNIANGYYAVEGRPMAVFTFVPAGLHNSLTAISGAYGANTPSYILVANIADAEQRRAQQDWGGHSMTDPAAIARPLLKWDDNPPALQHFAESAVRAYKIAMTEPRGPVLLVVDASLAELPIPDRSKLSIPKLTLTSPPAADPAAVAEVAKLLVAAENPLILAGDFARDEEGMKLMVELAETLQAPVQGGGRGMPNRHPLSGGGSVPSADVILGFNRGSMFTDLYRSTDQQLKTSVRRTRPVAKVITISADDLLLHGNYQHVGRFAEVDLSLTGDPQATLPSLIEACKKLITSDRRRVLEARGKKIAAETARRREELLTYCTYGWDASPISQPRLAMETWDVVKRKDWALVSRGHPLWNADKFYRRMGAAGGGGVGGALPISIGAALAHRKHGRLCVNFNPDGDMMFVPGALWSATHHRIPLLIIMENNRAYHQEVMHLQRIANRRQRGQDIAHRGASGTTITDPNIDFAQLARSMGAYAEGPITDPKDLRPALLRAVERVEKGEVALLDTVVQPR
ncbi:MAG: hypothetical protein A3H28_02405 [Acidobacteria bacterium RIFCSPLOWO2_02_FULL_61_28]|nr:MAG: hypothetical protein A3H28_02405 [Acidobacteria bacterium RIFCSPLOWO2_02_FULL_61_28]